MALPSALMTWVPQPRAAVSGLQAPCGTALSPRPSGPCASAPRFWLSPSSLQPQLPWRLGWAAQHKALGGWSCSLMTSMAASTCDFVRKQGLCSCKLGISRPRHPGFRVGTWRQGATWRRKQTLGGCGHEPRDSWGPRSWKGRKDPPLEPQEGAWPCDTLITEPGEDGCICVV